MKSKKKLIKKLKNSKFNSLAIIGHKSVDPDAVAASFGMKFLIEQLHPKTIVDVLIDGISDPTKEIFQYFNLNYFDEIKKKYDFLVIVDVNVPTQLGKFKELVLSKEKEKIIIIDHHSISDFSKDETITSYIDDERTSTSEMICEIMFDLNLKPSKDLMTLLMSGILYDSRRFFSLNKPLLKIVEKMFDYEVDYDLAINLIQRDYDNSEKIARLKCASRLHTQKLHGWQIAWSRIGSHEGTCARSILDLGADVALIYSLRKNETRLNVRAKAIFYHKTNIHFGQDIMNVLGKEFEGEGGGHSTAAALNIPRQISEKELKQALFKLLENQIKKT